MAVKPTDPEGIQGAIQLFGSIRKAADYYGVSARTIARMRDGIPVKAETAAKIEAGYKALPPDYRLAIRRGGELLNMLSENQRKAVMRPRDVGPKRGLHGEEWVRAVKQYVRSPQAYRPTKVPLAVSDFLDEVETP